MTKWFEYESGQAWCESAYKYQTLPMVAEFANTMTNLPIVVLPMLNAMMLRKYIREVNPGLFVPQLLLTFNGLASTYYHATLNLFGQLVDELSLVWMINMFLVVYVPVMKWFPQKFSERLTVFRRAVVVLTALFSGLCFLEPALNAVALMLFSVPAAVVIHYEGTHCGIPEIENFPRRILGLWFTSFSFWFADRLLCDLWLWLGTPYMHALFHLLAGLAGYTIFVMFSMIDIETRSPFHRLVSRAEPVVFRSVYSQFSREPYNPYKESSKTYTAAIRYFRIKVDQYSHFPTFHFAKRAVDGGFLSISKTAR